MREGRSAQVSLSLDRKLTFLKLALQNFRLSLTVRVIHLVDWTLRADTLTEVKDAV